MTIRLTTEHEATRFSLPELTDVVSLPMAPEALESPLKKGRWLVLAAAVWSGPDRLEIESLVMRRSDLPPGVHAAVRPFDDRREFGKWVPAFDPGYQSPVWVLLDGGLVRATWVGRQAIDVLREANEALASPTPAASP